jgi:hypothetical protein
MATYQLRPMSLGEILDTAFAVYREYFATLVVISIVCQGIPALVATYVVLGGGAIQHPLVWLCYMLLAGFGGLIAAGATVHAISEAYLGQQPDVGEALRYAMERIVPLFVAGLAKYLLMFLAFLLFFIPGIIVACGYAVVPQAVVLEEPAAATDALRRSWFLTKGYKGKALLLGFVLFLILGIPMMVFSSLALFVPAFDTVLQIGAELLQILIYPIFVSGFTLFYYDLRVRKEGFDLAHLSEQIGIDLGAAMT